MKMKLLPLLALIAVGIPTAGYAMSFSDNFDDGTLDGWTPKQGIWSNPGDYLLSSYDNYGIIWKDGSFGLDQFLQVDAYFDDQSTSKTAQLRLRSGEGGGSNSYFDHGYRAYVQHDALGIYNTTAPGNHILMGRVTGLNFAQNDWLTIAFSVTGTGNDTNLKLWVDNVLYLNVYDLSGQQHDDGGYVALGSSNHINRQIMYDNALGSVDAPPVPDAASTLLLVVIALGSLSAIGFTQGFGRARSSDRIGMN